MINQKVSIVIPTYNRSEYLKTCINSCLQQTIACEIIVVDHGSTDDTPEVARFYGDKIKYVRRELDSGVHFCWMDGILHATNDLIHLNFDDDWIEPTFIEKCLHLFKDDRVGMVLSDVKIFHENENSYEQNVFKLQKETGVYEVGGLLMFNLYSLTSPCAGIYRKKMLLDSLFIGQVPFTKFEYKGVGPDILFTLMTCSEYKYYGYVAESLAVFRDHVGSITIDASKNIEKTANIQKAYDEARIYFFINKIIRRLNIHSIAKKLLKYRRK